MRQESSAHWLVLMQLAETIHEMGLMATLFSHGKALHPVCACAKRGETLQT